MNDLIWNIAAIIVVIHMSVGFVIFILDYRWNKDDYFFEFVPWSCFELMCLWVFFIREFIKFRRILKGWERELYKKWGEDYEKLFK
jgi:hypothetical protein